MEIFGQSGGPPRAAPSFGLFVLFCSPHIHYYMAGNGSSQHPLPSPISSISRQLTALLGTPYHPSLFDIFWHLMQGHRSPSHSPIDDIFWHFLAAHGNPSSPHISVIFWQLTPANDNSSPAPISAIFRHLISAFFCNATPNSSDAVA